MTAQRWLEGIRSYFKQRIRADVATEPSHSSTQTRTLSVTLYAVQHPYWLTEASVTDDGRLIITSGDTDSD